MARGSIRRRSLLAIVFSFAAVAIVYLNIVPAPAGIEPVAISVDAKATRSRLLLSPMNPAKTAVRSEFGQSSESTDKDRPTSPEAKTEADTEENSRLALLVNLLLLEKGFHKIEKASDYTATFFKQESVDGELKAAQRMKMKIRHEPFSIYMKWVAGDRGRELIYVDGKNDGRMIVKLGGFKGRLLPALKLDPNGSLALKEARHPVTEIGLLNLTRRIIGERRQQLEKPELNIRCRMLRDEQFDDRPCFLFVLEFNNRQISPKYRKSVQYVDREYLLPVCIKNYTWPAGESLSEKETLDAETIIEHYSYSSLRLEKQLAEIDFDRSNGDYRFRR